MKPWNTRWLLLRPEPLALLLLVVLSTGCITRGTHREVAAERDRFALEAERFAKRAALLEASNESLSAERMQLIDQTEDLRLKRAALEADLEKLATARAELEAELAQRNRALEKSDTTRRRLESTYEELVADLESEVSAGQIEIEQLRSGLRLNVSDELLFGSGSAQLNRGGQRLLEKVAAQVRKLSQRVEVQGHTDNVPIRGGLAQRYPTNWELAGARAARVVRALEKAGLEPSRLKAVSYGPERPVDSNDTEAGRARNRRVEIRLQPMDPAPPPQRLSVSKPANSATP